MFPFHNNIWNIWFILQNLQRKPALAAQISIHATEQKASEAERFPAEGKLILI